MDFIDIDLVEYAEAHTQAESLVLSQLRRDTYANIVNPRMLAGHLQGKFLEMISRMISPRQILEIGTFTGYSAICLCHGLQNGGMLHTIDNNEELEAMVRSYLQKSGVEKKVRFYVGNALDVILSIKENFDLVYIDADKENYSNYYDLAFDKVNKGGYIIADNVLWSGKVLNKNKNQWDLDTLKIKEFNTKVHNDKRVENLLLPVRDGLLIVRKL